MGDPKKKECKNQHNYTHKHISEISTQDEITQTEDKQ